ncbi:hypothetical protein SELMODRAFT_417355 [Selaginella moellendorffii]|uniref:Peptide N-acetyl-beta-D-glucosaminyl asparaginase amidase A N-terminal domain-containing protein n=1 Tax=Selaginella moellendorffii TaxID=88036 RepID=D8S1Y7_SELML|nr:hypothetical protein SELMODRAFT_417355 [Selaginella moellendorffii]
MEFLVATLALCVILAGVMIEGSVVRDIVQPIDIPKDAVKCAHPLVNAEFSGASPLIETSYAPSTQCGSVWTKIVLELTGFCKGSSKEQKIGGVWLGGAQILHASTPLPTPEGTNWTIQRDATSFESLFLSSSNLSLIFLDVTASSSTNSSLPSTKSSYRISVTANFYLFKESTAEIIDQARGSRRFFSPLSGTSAGLFPPLAVLPIHPPPSNSTGLWFVFQNDQESSAMVTPPTNVVSARLQVFVSSHGDDEFWYKKGSSSEMREVVITLDGAVVDAIWPSPVIYSAGINASYWESVGSIGALNSPGYDVILDAFAPVLADGKPHKLGFRVIGATSIWFLGASLLMSTTTATKTGASGLIHWSASDTMISHPALGTTVASRSFSSVGYHLVDGTNFTTWIEHEVHSRRWNSEDGSLQLLTESKVVLLEQASGDAIYLHWTDKTSVPVMILMRGLVHQSFNHEFDSVLRIGSNNGVVQGGNFTSVFTNLQVCGGKGVRQSLSYRNTDASCYSRNLLVVDNEFKYDNVSTSCN